MIGVCDDVEEISLLAYFEQISYLTRSKPTLPPLMRILEISPIHLTIRVNAWVVFDLSEALMSPSVAQPTECEGPSCGISGFTMGTSVRTGRDATPGFSTWACADLLPVTEDPQWNLLMGCQQSSKTRLRAFGFRD